MLVGGTSGQGTEVRFGCAGTRKEGTFANLTRLLRFKELNAWCCRHMVQKRSDAVEEQFSKKG